MHRSLLGEGVLASLLAALWLSATAIVTLVVAPAAFLTALGLATLATTSPPGRRIGQDPKTCPPGRVTGQDQGAGP